jgi:hypothetical protein
VFVGRASRVTVIAFRAGELRVGKADSTAALPGVSASGMRREDAPGAARTQWRQAAARGRIRGRRLFTGSDRAPPQLGSRTAVGSRPIPDVVRARGRERGTTFRNRLVRDAGDRQSPARSRAVFKTSVRTPAAASCHSRSASTRVKGTPPPARRSEPEEVEGSPIPGMRERAEAALTTTGQASTAKMVWVRLAGRKGVREEPAAERAQAARWPFTESGPHFERASGDGVAE